MLPAFRGLTVEKSPFHSLPTPLAAERGGEQFPWVVPRCIWDEAAGEDARGTAAEDGGTRVRRYGRRLRLSGWFFRRLLEQFRIDRGINFQRGVLRRARVLAILLVVA